MDDMWWNTWISSSPPPGGKSGIKSSASSSAGSGQVRQVAGSWEIRARIATPKASASVEEVAVEALQRLDLRLAYVDPGVEVAQ